MMGLQNGFVKDCVTMRLRLVFLSLVHAAAIDRILLVTLYDVRLLKKSIYSSCHCKKHYNRTYAQNTLKPFNITRQRVIYQTGRVQTLL